MALTNEHGVSFIVLVQFNYVVIPKSRKMGLLHLFDIKDEIFKENFLKFRDLL